MLVVAITGGIASGKSTVAARLAERGAVVVDADRLAREVVEPGEPALAAIAARFGADVVGADGSLDRAALGSIVFSDERARLDLNAITHPAVWRRAEQRFEAARADDPDAIVVYDVPLLVEASSERPLRFDRVVAVVASREERLRRLTGVRGMTPADAAARIDSQASDADRMRMADTVIRTEGTLDDTRSAADSLWESLAAPQRRPPNSG